MSATISKREKVAAIIKILEELYPEVPIPLDHKDPYTLLIAVLLSAQCTDERVNQITPTLFAKADNPYDMVKLSIEEIQAIIRPCGLSPMKSKGIWHLSDMIIKQHNGEVPQDFAALEAMPAVGHKTASVVMSQGFGVPAFPVDTHIHRLMYRWGLSNGKVWNKPSAMQNVYSLEKNGMTCTYRLFFMAENTVPQGVSRWRNVLLHANMDAKVLLTKC